MIRVNLLPHREQKRKERRTLFFIVAGVDVAIAAVFVLLGYIYIDSEVSTQAQRNEFLKKENAKLDKDIEEIQKLQEEINRLLARKAAIEKLQGDRSEPVILLDQLARRVPDGVYLKSIKQDGGKVNITGYAQSSARVSSLMRAIDASPHMEGSELIEIRATLVGEKRRVNDFALNFKMKRQTAEDTKDTKAGAGGGRRPPRPATPPAPPPTN